MGKSVVKAIIFVLSLVLVPMVCNSQTLSEGKFYAQKNVVPDNYNFWIYTPGDYEEHNRNVPLIIFLHGASLCGNDLNRIRRYGVLDAIEKGKIIPAVVLAPQNSGGAWKPEKINELLEWTKQNYRIDSTRVYVVGMSLGGYGTLDFTGSYPRKIAAAMALCGGCSLNDMDGLGEFPLWIMHGTADRAVNVNQSKRVVSYLQDKGKDKMLRYDWLEKGSHGILARLFYLQKTYDWLFAHSTKDSPRTVDKNFDIDYSDIKQTYSELNRFKDINTDD